MHTTPYLVHAKITRLVESVNGHDVHYVSAIEGPAAANANGVVQLFLAGCAACIRVCTIYCICYSSTSPSADVPFLS